MRQLPRRTTSHLRHHASGMSYGPAASATPSQAEPEQSLAKRRREGSHARRGSISTRQTVPLEWLTPKSPDDALKLQARVGPLGWGWDHGFEGQRIADAETGLSRPQLRRPGKGGTDEAAGCSGRQSQLREPFYERSPRSEGPIPLATSEQEERRRHRRWVVSNSQGRSVAQRSEICHGRPAHRPEEEATHLR